MKTWSQIEQLIFLPYTIMADMVAWERTALTKAMNSQRWMKPRMSQIMQQIAAIFDDLPAAPINDFENGQLKRTHKHLAYELQRSILKERKKLTRVKKRIIEMQKQFTILEKTRCLIDAMNRDKSFPLNPLEQSALEYHRMKFAETWSKCCPEYQQFLEHEIEALELKLSRNEALLAQLGGFKP